MKVRIYVDASVVGGCEDDELTEHSLQLMECFVRGDFVLVVSTLTVQELAAAPDEVRRHLASVPEAHIETLQPTPPSPPWPALMSWRAGTSNISSTCTEFTGTTP